MLSLNKIQLTGNLTKDSEVRYTQTGFQILLFSLGVNRKYMSNGDLKTETSFFNIEMFGSRAEKLSEYLKKGSPVYIEGYIKQDRWEDSEGSKRSKIKIVCTDLQFLKRKENKEDNEVDGNVPF